MAKIAHEDDPKNRVIQFWGASNPIAWPKASSDNASIFEALLIIGKAKHGDAWDGTELDSILWMESPKAEYARSMAIAEDERRDARKPIPPSLTNPRSRGLIRSIDASQFKFPHFDHVRAWQLELREARWQSNWQALARLRDTVEWLAQRCRDGALPSFARPKAVGALWPIAAWEWNVENVMQRYVSNGACPRYFAEAKQTWDAYIFFDRADLDRAIATLAYAPIQVSLADLGKLSPYLRLAVQLALSKGYCSPEASETQAIREAEVRGAWTDALPDVPESKNAVEAIAKVMGFPDVRAIRQGQSARNGKRG